MVAIIGAASQQHLFDKFGEDETEELCIGLSRYLDRLQKQRKEEGKKLLTDRDVGSMAGCTDGSVGSQSRRTTSKG